jgi:hypothetical protein
MGKFSEKTGYNLPKQTAKDERIEGGQVQNKPRENYTMTVNKAKTFNDLRYGECLKHLQPIMRACASCEKLYECEHGQKVVFGDMSITQKVIELDYIESDFNVLRSMSLEELQEYNAARRAKKRLGNQPKPQTLTAGYYDSATKKWMKGIPEQGATETDAKEDTAKPQSDSANKLSAGYWDPEKRKWVTKV